MKTFFNILSAALGIYFFIAMLGTDDVGEKIENAVIIIICYIDLIPYRIFKYNEKK